MAVAFPDLDQVIRERLAKKSSMGFNAELKDHYDNEKNIFRYVETEDLRNFGMIPEFWDVFRLSLHWMHLMRRC